MRFPILAAVAALAPLGLQASPIVIDSLTTPLVVSNFGNAGTVETVTDSPADTIGDRTLDLEMVQNDGFGIIDAEISSTGVWALSTDNFSRGLSRLSYGLGAPLDVDLSAQDAIGLTVASATAGNQPGDIFSLSATLTSGVGSAMVSSATDTINFAAVDPSTPLDLSFVLSSFGGVDLADVDIIAFELTSTELAADISIRGPIATTHAQVIPLPAAAPLLLGALAGLGAVARSRRNRARTV